MLDHVNHDPFLFRRWVLFLLALCGLITAILFVTVFEGRQAFPAWFILLFLVSPALLLAVIGLYAAALLRRRFEESPSACSPLWIWFSLVASVFCTSSLHAFFPFRLSVAAVWSSLSPDLKFIKYNYVLTAVSLAVVVALAVLFFRGRPRLASIGLLLLAGIMLTPNDDCPNALNLPWIAWLGASPLMFLCNSVVVLIGYCALCGLWPRMSVLVMSGINAWVLVLGLGHTAQLDREVNLGATQSEHERQRQRPPISTLIRIPIEGHASFYVCSDARLGFKEGLPVILWIGHAFQQPETLRQFVGKFSEPVLLIWSDLLSDLSADTPVDDEAMWRTKRLEFAKQFSRYREILRFDERRVYLTGFSFAGVYAWMLAYDSPDRYAGVVAMSAVSYPQPIQQRLKTGQLVVTVVVRGENDSMFPKHLAREKQTGQAIESLNPHSRFLIKPGETHRSVAKYWAESLHYILQFKRTTVPISGQRELSPPGSGPSGLPTSILRPEAVSQYAKP